MSIASASKKHRGQTPPILKVGHLAGSNKYWLIDEDESAEDADEDDYIY